MLKEGTDSSQGVPQIISNISACQAISDAVRTTLGPRGMDKLIVDARGKSNVCVQLFSNLHCTSKSINSIRDIENVIQYNYFGLCVGFIKFLKSFSLKHICLLVTNLIFNLF